MAAQLGSASVAAIPTDLNFGRLAASFSNMPQTGIIKRYLQLMNPLGGDEQRKVAIRLGLIADGWTTVASGAARYIGEISGNEISRKIVDGVMKATLLTPHTQASKWAFGMEFLAYLGDNVKKSFNDLDPNALPYSISFYGRFMDENGYPAVKPPWGTLNAICLLYTSPSPRDRTRSRMPSSA